MKYPNAYSCPHGLLAGILVLSCFGTAALAQQPDAGSTLRDLQVPVLTFPEQGAPVLRLPEQPERAALPDDIRVEIGRFLIEGNSVIDTRELQALVADLQGRELDMEELYASADRITAAYRERGYLLSRALLPAQEIAPGGDVQLVVLEGRYGNISTDNSSLLSQSTLQRYLDSLQRGDLVNAAPLEASLLLIDDLPGVSVQTQLAAGTAQGETDLTVVAGGEPRVSGAVGLDNQGARATGEYRLNARLGIASPFGRGDALSANLLYSEEDQLFYQARYDLPLGVRGNSIGITSSRMSYQLAGDFVALDADGTADSLGLALRHTWLRSRDLNLRSELAFDRRELEDAVSGGTVVTARQADDIALALSGDWRDSIGGGGLSVFSLRWVNGEISLERGQFAPETPRGDFNKLTASLIRLQALTQRFSLYFALQAQVADGNLDSSEKMVLGGPQGLRGYPLGEGSADEAALATVELRHRFNDSWQLRAFADGGHARLLREPFAPGDNYRNLSSVGLGLDWQGFDGLQLSLAAAARTGEPARADRDENVRLWGSLQWQF